MSEVQNQTEIQKNQSEQVDTEIKGIPDLSNSDKQDLVKKMQEKSEGVKDGLDKELSLENITAINDFARKIITDSNLQPNHQLYFFNQLANILSQQFPEISKGLNNFGKISDLKGPASQDVVMNGLNTMQEVFIKKGYFINTDILSTGSDVIMKIEGKTSPSDFLGKTFNLDISNYKKSIVLNDASYEKFGYNVGNVSLVNKGYIESFINTGLKNGRYTEDIANKFNVDNIAQATINHETVHSILGDELNFPKRQEFSANEGKEWQIDGVDFTPTNSIQVEEFIAHSVGQATDEFEIMTNIYAALEDTKNPDNLEVSYSVGDKNGDYGLIRAFILTELKSIFKEKGFENFDSSSVFKLKSIFNEQINTTKEYNKLVSEGKTKKVEELLAKWETSGKGEKVDQELNSFVGSILNMLTPSDFKRIQEKCANQANKYIEQIKQKYSK